MRTVLGIDAAWTLSEPSGVAVALEKPNGWHLVAVANSYGRFHALADGRPLEQRPLGSSPNAAALLASASLLCGRPISLVAVDMPMARSPIVGRRISDNAVSKAYGARKCGTHTPTASRPGLLSDVLKEGFERAGYPLLTNKISSPGVIEVYPHPALCELSGAAKRLPYKASKVRSYWPLATPPERRARLYREWTQIIALLESRITGIAASLPPLPLYATGLEVKAYEDALDAVICTWVAVSALQGRAFPYGDEDSAIWIPIEHVEGRVA